MKGVVFYRSRVPRIDIQCDNCGKMGGYFLFDTLDDDLIFLCVSCWYRLKTLLVEAP